MPDGASPASSERSPHEGAALSAHPQGAATQGIRPRRSRPAPSALVAVTAARRLRRFQLEEPVREFRATTSACVARSPPTAPDFAASETTWPGRVAVQPRGILQSGVDSRPPFPLAPGHDFLDMADGSLLDAGTNVPGSISTPLRRCSGRTRQPDARERDVGARRTLGDGAQGQRPECMDQFTLEFPASSSALPLVRIASSGPSSRTGCCHWVDGVKLGGQAPGALGILAANGTEP